MEGLDQAGQKAAFYEAFSIRHKISKNVWWNMLENLLQIFWTTDYSFQLAKKSQNYLRCVRFWPKKSNFAEMSVQGGH